MLKQQKKVIQRNHKKIIKLLQNLILNLNKFLSCYFLFYNLFVKEFKLLLCNITFCQQLNLKIKEIKYSFLKRKQQSSFQKIRKPFQIILKMSHSNNSFLVQKQTLSYLIHHFQILKSLANRIQSNSNKPQSSQYILNPQIIKSQICQSVELMQKKLCFFIQNKSEMEFQDYITQFYQEQLRKLRDQLNRTITKCKKVQQKLRQNKINDSLKDFSSKNYSNASVDNNLSLMQERQTIIKLKKQISHCQSLIQQNQNFIQQQNNVIKQLSQQIRIVENRQNSSRLRYEDSVMKYDKKVKQIGQKFRQISKELSNSRKIYEKQLKELQLNNVKLMEDKAGLEEEVLLKSQEITLLAKRVYDLELCVNKCQRQLESKKMETFQNSQALLLLDKQVKAWKGKFFEGENVKQQKIEQILQDKRNVQQRNRQLNRQLEDVKRKVNDYYKVNQISSQKRQKILKQSLRQKQQQCKSLQNQINQLQSKKYSQSTQMKQLQSKNQQKQAKINQFCQQVNQLQQKIKQKQSILQNTIKKYNEQKKIMKRQIYQQVQELLKINEQTVKRVKIQQHKINELNHENQQKQKSKLILQKSLLKLQTLNDQLIKRNQAFMKQVQQYKDVKEDLQYKLQQNFKQIQELGKFKTICKEQEKNVRAMEKQLKEIKTKNQQLQEKIKELEENNTNNVSQSENRQSLTAQISLLKQEHHKKDFLIKQVQSKNALLQQQLRQIHDIAEVQRQKMKNKIKELEQLLKERYEFSNRPSNCG